MWRNIVLLTLLTVVRSEDYSYSTKWFTVPLDHFGFASNTTFEIKYLENDEYWDMGGGPIFFYTGNEGPIEKFAKQTGFMWDIAPEFKAKVVFAEHRYYGASMPFGDKSFDKDNLGYLTSAQALADYADLINYLQNNELHPKYPVIAFGGSYGGMLAAYLRMKYPHIVAGAIASSAPVHMFPGMVKCEMFNRIVTANYRVANPKCSENIRNSWSVIRSFAGSANNSEWLHKNWNLCGPANETIKADHLVKHLESMYVTLALVNYPFASDILRPLPAEPVKVVCQYLYETLTDKKLLEAIGKMIKIYTNYTEDCLNYNAGDKYQNSSAKGWDYQTCTEMVMPICTYGEQDIMFEPKSWNFTEYSETCHKKYNVYPRPYMARIEYGGSMLYAATNIVFSNGLLDPWTAGGILNSLSDTVKAVLIINAAHRLDLMPKNPNDSKSVALARNIHKENICNWISEFYEQQRYHRN